MSLIEVFNYFALHFEWNPLKIWKEILKSFPQNSYFINGNLATSKSSLAVFLSTAMRQSYAAVPRKNGEWAFGRWKIFFDKTKIFCENRECFPSNFSENLIYALTCLWYLKISEMFICFLENKLFFGEDLATSKCSYGIFDSHGIAVWAVAFSGYWLLWLENCSSRHCTGQILYFDPLRSLVFNGILYV